MHLVYIDETGNTGNNLNDPQQPLFLLCALLIHKNKWQKLGLEPKPIDESGIELVDQISHIGNEPFHDVLEWIKKGAARE